VGVPGKRLGSLGLILATALMLGGCGGGGDEGSAESWANGVCTNLSEWITELDGVARSLAEEGLGFDETDVRDGVSEAEDATDELASDLEQLGAPEAEGAQEAEEELDELIAELRDQLGKVERALDADDEPLEFAATVAAALSAAANQLDETLENLEGRDPGGELEDAFENSEDCDSVRDQVEDLGS
jgi:flagellar motility protein MotE (MotC chaperone)